MYVIVTGNGLYGPFASEDEAIAYAKKKYMNRHMWFVRAVEACGDVQAITLAASGITAAGGGLELIVEAFELSINDRKAEQQQLDRTQSYTGYSLMFY